MVNFTESNESNNMAGLIHFIQEMIILKHMQSSGDL